MNYLVTGGAGFIGSNLVERLVSEGDEVIVLDNLQTGSLDNLKKVRDKATTIISHCHEVHNIKEIRELDGIFHLGIPSSSPIYKQNPLLVGESIKEFTQILELAKKEDCRLIFASTSSIYNGNPTPWREDMKIYITDFYTEARHMMERLAKFYNDQYGTESIGLRFFSVYGPKEESKKNLANLISQFLWAMKKGEQPVIYGNGTQSRDFTYVEDVVEALLLAMKSPVKNDVFNVGTGESYSLNQMVEILNKILGTSIKPKYVANDIRNYVQDTMADTSKAERALGFKAKYTLESGIRKYA